MSEPIISLKNVSFAYPRQPVLLDIKDVSIAAGDTVMLSGPSGCGKSTLLGLLTGVLDGASGSISVLGEDLGKLSAAKRDALRARAMGYIFQSFNLLPYLSVLENVTLPCKLSSERFAATGGKPKAEAVRLLEHLGLTEDVYRKKPVTSLSIGQQQRVAAARALIGHPPLLIADEPTSALDEDAKTAFLSLMLEEAKAHGTTVIFITHDRRLSEKFDRHIELSNINKVMPAKKAKNIVDFPGGEL
jgi:putative ABC transport system ATP-binding protein